MQRFIDLSGLMSAAERRRLEDPRCGPTSGHLPAISISSPCHLPAISLPSPSYLHVISFPPPYHLRATSREHVLNGIAHDEQGDRLFVTGKCWPNIFQVSSEQ